MQMSPLPAPALCLNLPTIQPMDPLLPCTRHQPRRQDLSPVHISLPPVPARLEGKEG